jgi:hypothetical protein
MTEIKVGHRSWLEVSEMIDWCMEKFGTYSIDSNGRWVRGRWYYDNDNFKIRFAYGEDAVFFALKWA